MTGSTTVDTKKIKHTGTGRIARLIMYPMSLFESGESTGAISLHELFRHPDMDIDGVFSQTTLEQLVFLACRGGWPGAINKGEKQGLLIAREYLNNIVQNDISSVDGTNRNP